MNTVPLSRHECRGACSLSKPELKHNIDVINKQDSICFHNFLQNPNVHFFFFFKPLSAEHKCCTDCTDSPRWVELGQCKTSLILSHRLDRTGIPTFTTSWHKWLSCSQGENNGWKQMNETHEWEISFTSNRPHPPKIWNEGFMSRAFDLKRIQEVLICIYSVMQSLKQVRVDQNEVLYWSTSM